MWYGRHVRAPGYRPGLKSTVGKIPAPYDKKPPAVRPEKTALRPALLETLSWTDPTGRNLQTTGEQVAGEAGTVDGRDAVRVLPAVTSSHSSHQLIPGHTGPLMDVWPDKAPTGRQTLPPLPNTPPPPAEGSTNGGQDGGGAEAIRREESEELAADALDGADEAEGGRLKPPEIDAEGLEEEAEEAEEKEDPFHSRHHVLRRDSLANILVEAGLEIRYELAPEVKKPKPANDRIGKRPDFEMSSDEKISAVFQDVASRSDGAIAVGPSLTAALLELGYPYPWSEWIHEILEEECEGRQGLDADDFKTLVKNYEERLKEFLQDIFYNNSGETQAIGVMDLPEMICRSGVPLMADAGDELRGDLMAVAGNEASVNLRAFIRTALVLCYGAGLTNLEIERRSKEFLMMAGDDDAISADQLRKAMMWHEYLINLAGGPAAVHRLVDEIVWRTQEGKMTLDVSKLATKQWLVSKGDDEDTAKSAQNVRVTRYGYFAACRRLHERIAEGLSALLGRCGISTTTPVRESMLVPVLEEIGYLAAMPGNVRHFIEKCGYDSLAELRFEHLYSIIFSFCEASGFTDIERKIIDDSFIKFDQDRSGTLETDELGPVIRWLGYQPSQYRMYDFAESVGLAEGSFFDIHEFKHLVAQYMKVSLQGVRQLFGGREDRLPNTRIGELLQMVGYNPTEQEVTRLIERAGGWNESVNFREFKLLEVLHRAHVRKVMEANDGFTDADLVKYRKYFHENVPDGGDCISHKAMRNILGLMFPDTGQSQERHKKITKMVKDADADGNGQFSFEEYCMLMKNITEEIDRDMLVKGLRLKKDLGYTRDEVKQFRDLFNVYDRERNGEIEFDDLALLFTSIIDMTNESRRELRGLAESDRDGKLNFWQFLVLMHKVQKMNWHNINELIG